MRSVYTQPPEGEEKGSKLMKAMLYTVRVVTNGPVDLDTIQNAIKTQVPGCIDAEVTNFKVKHVSSGGTPTTVDRS